MDSTVPLDYVLFQLTPTRTRCELVIFAGKSNEKLAHGLLTPFISHLRSAKDQIAKGGYSVTLRPTTRNATWFTKATLQRFVRFVNTPEVLERFVTIEREIEQTEDSFHSYEASNSPALEGNASVSDGKVKPTASSKPKSDTKGGPYPPPEENSKDRLQRILETRTAVRRKEQAMVYARALAAGFDMNNLDDLISFSDAFGASRLRNACVNFRDLCKKKNEDRLWIDEVATMQACAQPSFSYLGTSGIVLAGEDDHTQNVMMNVPDGCFPCGKPNGTADAHGATETNQDNGFAASVQSPQKDEQGQVPIAWANQHPQYRHNLGPMSMCHQMPSYPGYAFPGMQFTPQYYPGNMQWPPNMRDNPAGFDREADDACSYRSSRKKERKFNGRGPEVEEQNGDNELSGSSSNSDSSMERPRRNKHGKKSSRKVVIHNINYISSKRDGEKYDSSESSNEDDDLDGDAIKEQVEQVVESLEESHKSSSRQHRKRNGSKHSSKKSLNRYHDHDENVSLNSNDDKKGNEHWGALQELLMTEQPVSVDARPQYVNVEEEYLTAKGSEPPDSVEFKHEAEEMKLHRPVLSDAFLVAEKGIDSRDSLSYSPNFDASENVRPITTMVSSSEEFMFSQINEGTETYSRMTISDCAADPSIINTRDSDDWFINKQSDTAADKEVGIGCRIVDEEYSLSSSDQMKKSRDVIFDDSLMIPTRSADGLPDPQLSTKISMISDAVEASLMGNGAPKVPENNASTFAICEPEDLYMVLDRGTAVDETGPCCINMDFEADMTLNEAVKMSSDEFLTKNKDNNVKKSGASEAKASTKDTRSRALSKSKPDLTSRNKRTPLASRTIAHKTKLEKEEENRKRMEELVLQRQKRIAERSASNGHTPVTLRKTPTVNKTGPVSLRSEKSKVQASTNEVKKVAKTVLKK